jgi:5-formyltetrahydrofolate cyclo-ligase
MTGAREAAGSRMRAVARPDSRFGYDLSRFVPDFSGNEVFPGKVSQLPCDQGDGPVFAAPDNCLQDVRAGLIAAGRPLLQRVAAGLGYHFVRPGRIAPADARFGGTLDGTLLLAEHLEPDAARALGPVDFVVAGATVVDPRTGLRLGPADGPDLDWARLAELGLVSPATPVVVCAHDYQLADTGLVPSPGEFAADWIITPTQTIRVTGTRGNGAVPPRDAPGGDAAWEQRRMREKVWADFRAVARPDSRFHWDFSSFIADFEGSERCVDLVRALPAWSRSPLLFITPDNSTELIRRAAMADGKPFVMTTYGIRRGFLLLDPADVPEAERSYAATLDGMDRYARPVSLEELGRGDRIGLLITGGSAVSLNGQRMGKGHGYFDLEWALLSEAGAARPGLFHARQLPRARAEQADRRLSAAAANNRRQARLPLLRPWIGRPGIRTARGHVGRCRAPVRPGRTDQSSRPRAARLCHYRMPRGDPARSPLRKGLRILRPRVGNHVRTRHRQ